MKPCILYHGYGVDRLTSNERGPLSPENALWTTTNIETGIVSNFKNLSTAGRSFSKISKYIPDSGVIVLAVNQSKMNMICLDDPKVMIALEKARVLPSGVGDELLGTALYQWTEFFLENWNSKLDKVWAKANMKEIMKYKGKAISEMDSLTRSKWLPMIHNVFPKANAIAEFTAPQPKRNNCIILISNECIDGVYVKLTLDALLDNDVMDELHNLNPFSKNAIRKIKQTIAAYKKSGNNALEDPAMLDFVKQAIEDPLNVGFDF